MSTSSTNNENTFMLAGFIVGIDTAQKTLSIRPSNTIVDNDGTKYGVGIINSSSQTKKDAILINLERTKKGFKDFITIKYDLNNTEFEKLCAAILHRGKVWLTLKDAPLLSDGYTAVCIYWDA